MSRQTMEDFVSHMKDVLIVALIVGGIIGFAFTVGHFYTENEKMHLEKNHVHVHYQVNGQTFDDWMTVEKAKDLIK